MRQCLQPPGICPQVAGVTQPPQFWARKPLYKSLSNILPHNNSNNNNNNNDNNNNIYISIVLMLWTCTCEGGERKPARVFSVKPARKMISNIDYPIISHLSNMPTFF